MKWNLNIALVAAMASCRLGCGAVLRINLAMVVAAAVQSSVVVANDDDHQSRHHNNTAIHRDNNAHDDDGNDYRSSNRSVATLGLPFSSVAIAQYESSLGDDELPADVVDQQNDLKASTLMDPAGSSGVNDAMMNETWKSTSGLTERNHRVVKQTETVVNAIHSNNVNGSSSDSGAIRVVVHNDDNDNDIEQQLDDQMQNDQPHQQQQQQHFYGNLRQQPPQRNHHHPQQQQQHAPNHEFNVEYTKETLIKQGRLKGMVRVMHSQSGLHNVDQYLGIPYAAAPVGNGRFMPPGE